MTGRISKSRRQELIFQILKNRGKEESLSVREIYKDLLAEGVYVHQRTVRRDLDELSMTHGLVSHGSNPEKFYPMKNYQFKFSLNLSESILQVLLIALNNLRLTSHEYFQNIALEAELTILNSLDERLAKELKESKKKYYFDFSMSGKPSSHSLKDFEKLMIAIRENRIITCYNESPYKSQRYNQKKRRFAPYLFILTSGTPYLIAEDQDDKRVKKLRATRLREVKLSKKSFPCRDIRESLSLDKSVGGWGGLNEESINIQITCGQKMANYFKEKTIHSSQKIEKLADHKYIVNFHCAESDEMIRIFSSFGGELYDVKPRFLLDKIKKIWTTGLSNYDE